MYADIILITIQFIYTKISLLQMQNNLILIAVRGTVVLWRHLWHIRQDN